MDLSTMDLASLIVHNFNNLSSLPNDDDIIIKYLAFRYHQDQIYTWVGPLLLAVNPCHPLPNLYGDQQHEKFRDVSNIVKKNVEPHVFAVAARAQYKLTHGLGKIHQVIIITGDSGSGKTYSAEKALNFLATMNQSSPNCQSRVSSILSKISRASPLISSFSTASTQRNKFSSRHGQLVQLQYLGRAVHGAAIRTFLLEKSRATNGSNNFHIFYQLLEGLSDEELDSLKLSRFAEYNIVNGEGGISRESRMEGYKETMAAMEDIGLSGEQRDEIVKVIALLIHLGNIEFKKGRAGCLVDVDKKESIEALQAAGTLMALPVDDLKELLTSSLIKPQSSQWRRHTVYHRAIDSIETCHNRLCSIIRFLYERLFHWIVDRLNKTLTAQGENYSLLGILDIFGFESFPVNGIEQLSINYASERLQMYFMEEYLEVGRQELEGEGLEMLPPPPTTRIYQQRLAVIEGSLFAVMNDACLVPASNDNPSLIHRLIPTREKSFRFLHIEEDAFVVKHYAGPVRYSTFDMLPKNTDKVPNELASTLLVCNNEFLSSLVKSYDGASSRGCGKKNTSLAKLKQSLDALIKELDKCDSQYIRCVRAGSEECCFESEFKAQLAYSGILDALPLARCEYPVRLRYEEFHKKYSKDPTEICDPVQRCKQILVVVLSSEELQSSVHFGRRMIFLTETILYKLERIREEYHSDCARKIQRLWAKHKGRKELRSDCDGKERRPTNLTRISQNCISDDDVFRSPVPVKINGEDVQNNGASANVAIDNEIPKVKIVYRKECDRLWPKIWPINGIISGSKKEAVDDKTWAKPCSNVEIDERSPDERVEEANDFTNLSKGELPDKATSIVVATQELYTNYSNITFEKKNSLSVRPKEDLHCLNSNISKASIPCEDKSKHGTNYDKPEANTAANSEEAAQYFPGDSYLEWDDVTTCDSYVKTKSESNSSRESLHRSKVYSKRRRRQQSWRNAVAKPENDETTENIPTDLYLELDDDTRCDHRLESREDAKKEGCSGEDASSLDFASDLHLELDDHERCDTRPEIQEASSKAEVENEEDISLENDNGSSANMEESCEEVLGFPMADESDGASTCQLHSSQEDLLKESDPQSESKEMINRHESSGFQIMESESDSLLPQIRIEDVNGNAFSSDDMVVQETVLESISETSESSLEQERQSKDTSAPNFVEDSDSETSSTTIVTVKHGPLYKQSQHCEYKSNIETGQLMREKVGLEREEDAVSEMNSHPKYIKSAMNVLQTVQGDEGIKLCHLENSDITQWLNGRIYRGNVDETENKDAEKQTIQGCKINPPDILMDKRAGFSRGDEKLRETESVKGLVKMFGTMSDKLISNNRTETCLFRNSSCASVHSLYSDITFSNKSSAAMITLADRADCLQEMRLCSSIYIQQYSHNVPQATDRDESEFSEAVTLQIYEDEISVIHDNCDTTYKRSKRPKVMQNWSEGLSSKLCETIEIKAKVKAPTESPWTSAFLMENYGDRRKKGNHSVYLDNQLFFYKNGIFSRRRLSEIPIDCHDPSYQVDWKTAFKLRVNTDPTSIK